MFSRNVLYESSGHNQLQFNLDVPLTTKNVVTHFQQPRPIMIERVGGHSAIPGGVRPPMSGNQNVSASSSCNYSLLSEEKMSRMSKLAQRNLKNMKLRNQMRDENAAPVSRVSHPPQGRLKSASNISCSRQRRNIPSKPRYPGRAKEAVKNRPVGSVQTHPKKSVSHAPAEGDSMATSVDASNVEKEVFFPAKPAKPAEKVEVPQSELGKVQVEIEGSLGLLTQIVERALEDGNAKFLRPAKGRNREGLLHEEESLDRVKQRSQEQNTRFARTLYNMRQKVKQLQREMSQADLNVPAQKRNIEIQSVAAYRGVSRALHTFIQQLPCQDLTYGLPTQYSELTLLVQQLTALSSIIGQHSDGQDQNKILSMLDELDGLNSKWSTQYMLAKQARDRRGTVGKEWVSDTKVDTDLFSRLQATLRPGHAPFHKAPPQHQMKRQPQRGRPTKRAPAGNRASTKSGKNALSGQSQVGFVTVGSGKPAPSVAWEVNLGKSCMLPTNLIAQREKVQRAVELSKQTFTQPTVSSRLRSSPQRPSSAPASNSRRKEVNFDLDHKAMLPWIPAGSGPYRPRSASLEQRSYHPREMSAHQIRQDTLHFSPNGQSLKVYRKDKGDSRDHKSQSLPSYRQFRSPAVSDSFLDSIEKRLFDRMMQRRVADFQPGNNGPDQLAQSLHVRDEALDITDLYVEGDSTLNDTNVSEVVRKEAAGMMDAPTLENIKLRLDNMQRTQREIRERWSTIKFADSKPLSRKTVDGCPPEPVMLHVESRSERQKHNGQTRDFSNKPWSEEPLLFTKSYLNHTGRRRAQDLRSAAQPPVQPAKHLVSLKQSSAERILNDQDRFDSYLLRKSHHPSGKFDPWSLVEEISDEILTDCLKDVSEEVEKFNEEIANHMYKSEFMVTGSPQVHPFMSPKSDIHSATSQDAFKSPPLVDFGGAERNLLGDTQPKETFGSSNVQYFGNEETKVLRATEPLLDDVSQLMSKKHVDDDDDDGSGDDGSEDRSDEDSRNSPAAGSKGSQDARSVEEDKENEGDDDEYEEDDEDDGNYSDDDDFEDVSDVEL